GPATGDANSLVHLGLVDPRRPRVAGSRAGVGALRRPTRLALPVLVASDTVLGAAGRGSRCVGLAGLRILVAMGRSRIAPPSVAGLAGRAFLLDRSLDPV